MIFFQEVHAERFIKAVISDLICVERDNLDLESVLTVYLELNEEFKTESKDESSFGVDIQLKPEAIDALINIASKFVYCITSHICPLSPCTVYILNFSYSIGFMKEQFSLIVVSEKH